MENIYENITLDLHDVHSMAAITVKQGDTARILKIHFMEEGVPYSPGDGCYAVLVGIKSDGTYLYNHCEVEKDCIRYEFTKQTASVSGEVNCEVRLYDSDDRMLTSGNFQILVEEQLSVDDLVESGAETTALNHLVSEATAVIQTGSSLFGEGQNLLETAGTVLEEVKQAKDATCLAADNAVKLVEEAEQVICQASDAAKAADSAAQRANEASVLAEDAYEVAQSADRKVETLRQVVSTFHNNIVEEASGKVISLEDSSEAPLTGLKLYGKTTQKTTSGKNLFPLEPFEPVTKNGITVAYENGGIRLSGELLDAQNNGYIKNWADSTQVYPAGTYTLTFSALCQPQIVVRFLNVAGNSQLLSIQNASEMRKTFTLNEPFAVGWSVYRNSKHNQNISPEIIYIQIEEGSAVTEWELYTGGIPAPNPDYPQKLESPDKNITVTVSGENVQDQTLLVSTHNGLPGIPVSSGGNYRDENDQWWICDELDFAKGVYVQRVRRVAVTQTASQSNSLMILPDTAGAKRPLVIVSNYTDGAKFELSDDGEKIFIRGSENTSANRVDLTSSELNALLAQTPMELLYVLAEEKTVPLSEIDPNLLVRYSELHTNYPATGIHSDKDVYMDIKYVADTKAYVDKKFQELAAALVNNV